MKKFLLAAALLPVLLIWACAPTAQLQLSAGRIGCPTGEIVIGDVDSTSHTNTWSAVCRGQTYFCSSTDEFREVVCKPQLKQVAAPAPVPAPVAQTPPPAPVVPVQAAVAPPPPPPPPVATPETTETPALQQVEPQARESAAPAAPAPSDPTGTIKPDSGNLLH